MKQAIVVSDTSPIRALHFLGQADLLCSLFGEVLVPPAVAAELEHPRSSLTRIAISDLTGVRIIAPRDVSRVTELLADLDPGEAEAIVLALEVHADYLIADENKGRQTAARLGLTVIGALGVLLKARERGLTGPIPARIQRLRAGLGFFIDERLEQIVLETERKISRL